MNIKSYTREENELINSIIKFSHNAGLNADFISSNNSNLIYDQIILSKKNEDKTPFGKIDIQSNIGTTFNDPKKIIKGYTSENSNNIVYDLIIKGIIEKGKEHSHELSFEERLDNISNNLSKEKDFDKVLDLIDNSINRLFTYTDDAKDFMNEATSSFTNFDYDPEEYDSLEGGREERDTLAAHNIAKRYLIEKYEAKLEEKHENESSVNDGPCM